MPRQSNLRTLEGGTHMMADRLKPFILPVAIVIAVLFFGGLWGLWGVFFAIPLATLVSAILSAWPSSDSLAVS